MYVVTNRNIQSQESPPKRFGSGFNGAAYDELRLAKAKRVGSRWKVDILDEPAKAKGSEVARWPSEDAYVELQNTMRTKKRNCVFYVHGYRVKFADVLERSAFIERRYNVEVVAFTWPSDGKTTRYLSDKRDAVRSIHALDRCLQKLKEYMVKYHENDCGQSFSLLLHSMGNYLFKHLLKSSIYEGETLLFDNVVMAAADVNHHDHVEWVERVRYRKRLYITINENDYALGISRAKLGSAQRTRLGHCTRGLSSRNAEYLDFTLARGIGNSHAYFAEANRLRNQNVKKTFNAILNGKRIEESGAAYDYCALTNAFVIK